MTRQVNLNNQSLLAGFGPVQLPTFLLVILCAFIAAGIWIYLAWAEQQKLLQEEAQWAITLENELAQLTEFQAQFPNLYNEAELIEQNQNLNLRLAKTRETFSGLANQVENAIEGFNEPLKQLSDYDVDGLWLEKISLKDGKRSFALEGFAQIPALIPQYLEQLGQSSFNGISIEQLSVDKDAEKDLWRFVLSNERNGSNTTPNSAVNNTSPAPLSSLVDLTEERR